MRDKERDTKKERLKRKILRDARAIKNIFISKSKTHVFQPQTYVYFNLKNV